MDVFKSLNGMLIKGLGCCVRCRAHHQPQNLPLEMSVVSAERRQNWWPADAPLSTSVTGWSVLDLAMCLRKIQFNFLKPAARLQNSYLVSGYNGNRQSKTKI